MHYQKTLLAILISYCVSFSALGQTRVRGSRYDTVYKQYLGATCPLEKDSIQHFVYFSRDRELIHDHPFLKVPRIAGAQIMYSWRELEPERGKYDFSIIREDYQYLLAHGKKLFIQFQDVSFSNRHKPVPDYLLTAEFDGGCVQALNDSGQAEGWVAKRWNPQVQQRFALLMAALGKAFDGKIEGINLQETAVGVHHRQDSTFTNPRYAECIKENMLALKTAFPHSTTMQYANFMPGEWLPSNDKGYLRSVYQYGQKIGVGLGSPDLMIRRKGQLNHPIAMMHEHTYTVPLGIAIQDGNYIGTTGSDDTPQALAIDASGSHRSLVPLLHAFAKDFLHLNYMFWVNQEPYFSQDVLPCLKGE